MSKPGQYRAKAAEYTELAKTANSPNDVREFQKLERSFTALADNEQWLTDNHDQTVHATENGTVHATENGRAGEANLAADEEHVLRCLGAALLMQWNTLPTKLQRELFDNAGSMGERLDTATLRGQIARFLHKHKDGEDEIANPPFGSGDEHAPHMPKMNPAESKQSAASQQHSALARWDDEGGAAQTSPQQ